MILQNRRLAIPKTLGDFPPLLAIQHHAAEIRVNSMALIETQAVLRDHIKFAAES